MPVNFDALIRYHTIDKCLQNNFRKWKIKDLAEACYEALDEAKYRSEKNCVSDRTIEIDIRVMRGNLLGYNAPIGRKNGTCFYEDRNYSIKNATLSENDIKNISLAAKVLGQYKGFSFAADLSGILDKLETRVNLNHSDKLQNAVRFEDIPPSKGLEYIGILMDMISNEHVVEISYERFNSDETKKHVLHPYLLKEYRNRWYILGLNAKHNGITTYALDRINGIEGLEHIQYVKNKSLDPDTYFNHTIGITTSGEDAVDIILEIDKDFAPYFLTQPIHASQKVLEEKHGKVLLALNLIINTELETLLLGYADRITVISPEILKKSLIHKLQTSHNKYLERK